MSNYYEQKCLDADKELAHLLGWTEIRPYNKDKWIGQPAGENLHYLIDIPRYTKNDAEAFKLIVEHDASPLVGSSGVVVANAGGIIWYKDFPDRYSCVRFAIVQATINKLRSEER